MKHQPFMALSWGKISSHREYPTLKIISIKSQPVYRFVGL